MIRRQRERHALSFPFVVIRLSCTSLEQSTVSEELALSTSELVLWRKALDVGESTFHEFIVFFAGFNFVKNP